MKRLTIFPPTFLYWMCFACSVLSFTVQPFFAQQSIRADIRPLGSGSPVERELKSDEVHSFSLALKARQFLNVVVEQKGIDVVIALFDPKDVKIAEMDSPNGTQGPEPLFLIAPTTGTYRLEVRSLDKAAPVGKYEAKILELRASVEKDKYRVAAQRAYSEAVQLQAQGTEESLQASVKKFEEVLLNYRTVSNKSGEAETLNTMGRIYEGFGDMQKALSYYLLALQLYKAVGDKGGEGMILNNIGSMYSGLHDQKKALDYYTQARPLMQAVGDKAGEGGLLANIGKVFDILGDKQKALDYYSQALAISRAAGDKQGEGITFINIGKVYDDLNDKKKALGYYSQALPLLRLVGDKVNESTALNNTGAIYAAVGEMQKALDNYNQALPLSREIGDKPGEANTLNHAGMVYRDLGENQKALDYHNRALRIYRALGDKQGEAVSLASLGRVYDNSDDKQKALDYFSQSLSLRRLIGDKYGEGVTLTNIGDIYSDLGDKQKALDYFNQALPLTHATGDKRGEGTTLNNIGGVYSATGERQKALDFFAQALTLARTVGDKRGEAYTLTNIGRVYDQLGEKLKALEYYNQALPLRRAVSDKYGEANTLTFIGIVYKNSGDTKKALDYFEQALPLNRAVGDKIGEAATLQNIGSVYSALGDKQKALDYNNQVLTIVRATGAKVGEAVTLSNIGLDYTDLGDTKKAIDFQNQSLPLSRAIGDKNQEAKTLNHLFYDWNLSGNTRFAVFYGKQSVNAYQALRSNVLGLDKNLQQTFLKSIEFTYRNLATALLKQGRLPEAQQVLNLFKDQQYFDFRSNKQTAPLAFTARETELAAGYDQKLDAMVTAIRRLDDLKRGIGIRKPTEAEAAKTKQLETDLQKAKDDNQAFLKKAEAEFAAPIDDNDRSPDITDLQEMQTTLRETSAATKQNTIAVYTIVGRDEFRELVITPNDIFSVTSPVKGADLNKKALELWNVLRSPKYDPRAAANELYNIVFSPLVSRLPKGTETVLWSLDGNLRYVPMAALYDGKRYLAERYENVIFTRADKERMTREVNPVLAGTGMGGSEAHSVELLGDQFDASALPAVKTELNRIFKKDNSKGILSGGVLIDEQFTKQAMLNELKARQPLVHIASHFRFEAGDEARSFLLLGDGTPFTLDEMKQQTDLFSGVDLLTLSACETAAQKPDANGREVDGFAELAQRLGAGAVMASLWEVADNSTAELMTRFYQDYRGRTGANKAEALRRSQLALLKGKYKENSTLDSRQLTRTDTGGLKTDAANLKLFQINKKAPFSHPYYWSPFILIGNWK